MARKKKKNPRTLKWSVGPLRKLPRHQLSYGLYPCIRMRRFVFFPVSLKMSSFTNTNIVWVFFFLFSFYLILDSTDFFLTVRRVDRCQYLLCTLNSAEAEAWLDSLLHFAPLPTRLFTFLPPSLLPLMGGGGGLSAWEQEAAARTSPSRHRRIFAAARCRLILLKKKEKKRKIKTQQHPRPPLKIAAHT